MPTIEQIIEERKADIIGLKKFLDEQIPQDTKYRYFIGRDGVFIKDLGFLRNGQADNNLARGLMGLTTDPRKAQIFTQRESRLLAPTISNGNGQFESMGILTATQQKIEETQNMVDEFSRLLK